MLEQRPYNDQQDSFSATPPSSHLAGDPRFQAPAISHNPALSARPSPSPIPGAVPLQSTQPFSTSATSATARPGRPPRTSSLLPPPRLAPSSAAGTAPPYITSLEAIADNSPRSSRIRRPQTPPRQPDDIISAAPQTFLNLNRGSSSTNSTASSRASFLGPRPSFTSPGRRASIDASSLHHKSPPSSRQSPRDSYRNLRIASAMGYEQDREQDQARGHSRGRSGKGSADLGKTRAVKPPSQKAMLSRALQKANTAVQLDNAQNFEGAREAYAEACELLRQVLQRTTGDEDKRKLEAIRRTYTSRIDELDQLGPWPDTTTKALPARPGSAGYGQDESVLAEQQDADEGTATGAGNYTSFKYDDSSVPQQVQRQQLSHFRGESSEDRSRNPNRPDPGLLQSSFSRSPAGLRSDTEPETQPRLGEATYMPPPLTSQPPSSPPKTHGGDPKDSGLFDPTLGTNLRLGPNESHGHTRDGSQGSWLDPIDETPCSSGSSVHSRTSSLGYRRKHIRAASGNTETEFDTALDAAIEAAYDEGYEPMESEEFGGRRPSEEEIVAQALRKVEIARERVRQTEREAYGFLSNPDEQSQTQLQPRLYQPRNTSGGFYDDDDSSEEEERLLEEMTRDLAIEDFSLGQQRRPSTKGSESNGTATGTWQNSMSTNPPPVPKSFLTVNDLGPLPPVSKALQPSAPPPTQSLPQIPTQRSDSPQQSVRNRRLSGQNRKQLKIETAKLGPSALNHSETAPKPRLAVAGESREDLLHEEAEGVVRAPQRRTPPVIEPSPLESRSVGSPVAPKGLAQADDAFVGRSASPSVNKLRKNFSSSSLRSMKSRNLSLSNLDDASDMSPSTPSSNHFGISRAPAMPALPTPLAAAFREQAETSSSGGLYLFDDTLHLPNTPGSPNPMSLDPPVPLESCPTDFMLRPFWLMRCLYQTLVHPRGGYMSTKLFVPRDVWRVKGVKLKNIEDKIGNCDYLTAALLNLAKVDTYDADAVLEEMQSLEGVLEQVQASLSRKLGSEVGVQSSGILFKEASPSVDGEGVPGMPRSASVSNKPSSFSWRRLRSKNSAVGMSGSYGGRSAVGGGSGGGGEAASLPTLPMTPNPTTRPAKRDVGQAVFMGPNAHYMSSLARLFDAAQAIDQIARQVEDPGLRHADKTQVGLELCTRHAAEFFGFYICRFVMADLSMLLDKFIKRGSEWVLA